MQNEKTIIKIGIADCYGLESYLDKQGNEKELSGLVIRARANRQRHAVVYEAEISRQADQQINRLIKRGDCETALRVLKKSVKELRVATTMGNVEKSWELIPNSELDPWK